MKVAISVDQEHIGECTLDQAQIVLKAINAFRFIQKKNETLNSKLDLSKDGFTWDQGAFVKDGIKVVTHPRTQLWEVVNPVHLYSNCFDDKHVLLAYVDKLKNDIKEQA